MNKKVLKVSFFILIFIFVLVLLIIIYPKKYEKDFTGIIYRLGKENQEYCESVSISFKGKLTRLPLLNNKYVGDIIIGDKKMLEGTLEFDSHNSAIIFDSNLNSYGQVYFDDDYNNLTITVFEPTGSVSEKGWDGENGLMISAPATCREEALHISNELMKSRLVYAGETYLLK